MKKSFTLIVLIASFFIFSLGSFAETEKVSSVGQKILSSNNLPTKVEFIVSEEDEVNAYADINNEVHVYNGLLKMVETDDELAAVISHEIGHIVNKHIQKQSIIGGILQSLIAKIKKPFASKIANGIGGLSMLKLSRSAEYEADLTGVDLMVGAGYNPQAMLSFLNKVAQNYIDVIETHPSGNKRLQYVYDYISFNYPEKLQKDYNTDSYRKFRVYIDGVVKERNSDPKKMAEYIKKQTKLRNDRIKRAKAIRETSYFFN